MQTELCKKLGLEFPIFAFSHCRDVVAAVSQAGGLGVLGATGFNAEQLEIELSWIDEQLGDKPYGVDIIIPNKYEGKEERDPEKLKALVNAAIPEGHRQFADQLLDELGVPRLPDDEPVNDEVLMTDFSSAPLVDVALVHDNVKLIANALGTPPAQIVKQIQDSGRMIGALCGRPEHARKHLQAGLDFIVAQGGEAGGHTGDIGSIVLWPEVVDVAGDVPVIAAGGIGSGRQMVAALAAGAQGVWCGSIWLTSAETGAHPAQVQAYLEAGINDTVRSRSFSGKPVRMLRNAWTEAWDAEDTPEPLAAPMQAVLTNSIRARVERYPEQGQPAALSPVGQIVGRMNQTAGAAELVMAMVDEYLETLEKLGAQLPSTE